MPASPPERLVWTPELVARFWDGVGHTRLEEHSFARVAGRQFVMAVRPHLVPGGRHLDFGAGDGTLTRLLIESGFPCAAHEPSEERRRHIAKRVDGAGAFLGFAGPGDAPYDAVILAEVIEHVLDEQMPEVLGAIHGFLRPHGRLLISTPHAEDIELGMTYCPVSNLLFHRWQHMRSLTPASIAALLAPHGFRVRVTHVIEFSQMGFGLPPRILRSLGPFGTLWRWWRTRQLERMFASGRSVELGNRTHLLCIAERV